MSNKLIYICFSALYFFGALSSFADSPEANLSEISNEDLLKEAKKLADQQKYEEAVLSYKELLMQNPSNIDYLLELGLLNVRLGHRKEAIELYNRALTIEPDNEQIEVALAFAYLFENDLQKSDEVFKKVIEKSPDNTDALAGIGYIAMLNGKEDEAEQFFYRALKINPKHIAAGIYLGNLRLRQNRLSDAKEIFEILNAEVPNDQDVQQGLLNIDQAEKQALEINSKEKIETISQPTASTTAIKKEDQLVKEAAQLREQKKYKEASELYEDLVTLDPQNVDYLLSLGKLYVAINRKNEAIYLYERALSLQPKRQDVRTSLAFAYLFENNLENSQRLFQVVLEQDSENLDALAGLGNIAAKKGNMRESEDYLQKAIQIDPKHIAARIYLGNLRLRQNRLSDAKEIFETLNAEVPNDQDVQQGLLNIDQAEKQALEINSKEKIETISQPTASTTAIKKEDQLVKEAAQLREQKKYKEASELYEDLVTLDPQNVDYLLSLGQFYVTINRKNEAIYLYERALSLQPKRQDVRTSLAFAYLFENNLENSQRLFQVVLEQDSENLDALAGLGNIAAKKGNMRESEDYLQKAIQIDPKNITALIYLADLRMRQKNYSAASEIYRYIAEIEPNDPDIHQGLVDVQGKILADQSKQLLKEKRYEEAAHIYENLIDSYPKNVDYLVDLANIYKLEGNKIGAIQALNRALELDPNRQDIRIILAFAYLFDDKLDLSKELFQLVLEKESNNSEAFAGLGRIEAIQNHPEEADQYYQKALEINPNNATALEFRAILKLKQKKYKEALGIYSKLLSIDPGNGDYSEGFHNSQEQPLVDRARRLREGKDFAGASALLEHLIALSPEKIEYFLMLGPMYVNMDRKNDAIDLYNQGLVVKPNDKDLLRALGFIYLNKALEDAAEGPFRWSMCLPFLFLREKTNLCISKEYFESVLEQDPQDASALAGMGRIALIKGSVKESEELYFESLEIEPENTTALSYLAALQSLQKKYYSADSTYRYLMQIDPQNDDVRINYREFRHIKEPFLNVSSYYEEENEKDQIVEVWDARLKNYGGSLTYVFPIINQLKLIANFACDYIVLKNLITGGSIYSVDIQTPKMGFIWNYSPYISIAGGAGVAFFSQYHQSTFFTESDRYFLPYFNISYNKDFHTFSFETIGDAPIVARNFLTNQSALIARQFLNGFYEYDFTKRRAIGASATYAWYYNDIKNNQFQSGSAWIQITPPCYWENISLRYQFNYGRFNDLTIDYYTFRPQTSHWLKLDLTKKWCDDQVVTEAGYWHCWQRSFENGQIIVVVPVAVFHWVNREIDSAYARVKFIISDCLNANVVGTYSHDNFDYTTASISANIHMEF